MLMDILVEFGARPGGSNNSILLLGPPGVGTFLFSKILHMLTCLNRTGGSTHDLFHAWLLSHTA